VSECRNCGERNVHGLGAVGKLAPFFLKRVVGLELADPKSPSPIKRWLRRIAGIPGSPLRRMTSQFAFAELEICSRCSFIQTQRPFHDDDIMRLYRDYRSPSYNQERIRYEPSYAAIASRVGHDSAEVEHRTEALEAFLGRSIASRQLNTILDYGGSDGRFIPKVPARKFVFEVSDVQPISGVTRIAEESSLKRYSIVLLAHVIEHVPHPLELVRKVAAYVEPGGFLYIETPQEIADEDRVGLENGTRRFDVNIHEHINSYCPSAVHHLVQSAGLRVVGIESSLVDVGWAKAVHVRALGQKEPSE